MANQMTIIAIVQARMESTRFPGKVMKNVNEKKLIEILLHRLSQSKMIDEIVVATSSDESNLDLKYFVESIGFSCVVGSRDNVLERYVTVGKKYNADVIVRITGDCPLIDFNIVDLCIKKFLTLKVNYLSNTLTPTYPDGMDVEVIEFDTLAESLTQTLDFFDLEHVTPYIRKSDQYSKYSLEGVEDYSSIRLTVDLPEDLVLVSKIVEHFHPRLDFNLEEIVRFTHQYPELLEINAHILRNEGSQINKGQKLWNRAKKAIPGGNSLLSKRPEMFLPEIWPAYFSKAKGCKVWDLDNNEFLDMSLMGVGTNILGYGHPEVDEAVNRVVADGNMSTLNSPDEVYLAEKLIELHPWAEMVKFARTGGEANAIAIRIARAASGKDQVAICGYHGWHDWYLSANLGESPQLDGHLLPGLEPNGVPRNLKNTVFTFTYNDYDELLNIVKNNNIGVIKMEVVRNEEPKNGFLEKVRKLATEKGIVLIFDECTSGFRETFGGIHKKYNIEPDMATFGKALGNGYAITAVIGRREVMDAAQSTFISSTFWTERIGPAAALKTLEVMESEKSWEVITSQGLELRNSWNEIASRHNLNIQISGIPALSGFSFISKSYLEYKTYLTQEMLKAKILASNSIYFSIAHSTIYINIYLEKLEEIFTEISKFETGSNVKEFLDGPTCHSGFKRLN